MIYGARVCSLYCKMFLAMVMGSCSSVLLVVWCACVNWGEGWWYKQIQIHLVC